MEQYGPFAGRSGTAHLSARLFADFFDPLRGAGWIPAPRRGPLFHGLGYGPECHRAETINGTPA